jgi:hypothetical protein
LVNSHELEGLAAAESRNRRFSGVQELLNDFREDSSALGVEMNAVYVELPTVDARDLIKALAQDHFPKQVVTVEGCE